MIIFILVLATLIAGFVALDIWTMGYHLNDSIGRGMPDSFDEEITMGEVEELKQKYESIKNFKPAYSIGGVVVFIMFAAEAYGFYQERYFKSGWSVFLLYLTFIILGSCVGPIYVECRRTALRRRINRLHLMLMIYKFCQAKKEPNQ